MIKFNVHDGMGCILLEESGLELLILTARHSDAVVKRFKELGITKIFTKVLKKRDFIKDYLKSHDLAKHEVAFMGDDLQDLAAINEVGVFFTSSNAIDIVKESAHYVTLRSGGNGAVREISDLIIRSKGSTPLLEFNRNLEKWPNTQTIEPLWEVNSGVFLTKKNIYQTNNDRIGDKPYLFELSDDIAFDIDWLPDYKIAEALYFSMHGMAELSYNYDKGHLKNNYPRKLKHIETVIN